MRERRWIYRNREHNREEVMEMSRRLSLSPVILTVLLNRGISGDEQIKAFLSKSMQIVHNPMELPDMDKAAERIYEAVENKEKICIYGDYDVDGITSTAILYQYLMCHGADVDYYIPGRITEGYGVNIKAVNKISKTGCRLLITVDCGITSVGETELAKAQGMDVIITDHHTCKAKIPAAVAVVNPKRSDSAYPFHELAGAGVAFKTVLALSLKFGENTKEVFYKYAAFAAIGTVADVVSLTDENRTIVDRGILALSKTEHAGLCALMEAAGIKEITAGGIAFGLAPRLNAAGRLDKAEAAVELLLCSDKNRAGEIASMLNTANDRRRLFEQRIYEEAVEMCESDPDFDSKRIIVLAGEGWHHGVIGIVASRLLDRFYRPVILISYEDNKGKGSGRSIEGFNLFDGLTYCSELLEKYGGHSMAAGITIDMDNFEGFADKINKYAAEQITDEMLIPSVKIDCKISPAALTAANIKALDILEPSGAGNETPVFCISGVQILSVMQMGETKNHLRLQVSKNGSTMTCVAFKMGELYESLPVGALADIAFTPQINVYNGRENLQLRLCDIKIL
ncbi:MAG: single-stranded-DNA-specific exonuclease RecJ [Clostridia bacterium]|nr:single-stranded-DNA-specific exonuclease RecJ [Clostridia bacterium]